VAEDWYADVMEFHRAMAPDLIGTTPKVPESASAELRMRLVCEETYELEQAMERGDLPGVADAVADAIYVLLGLAVTFGIDLRPVWAAVHAANMAKVGGPRRADGKRLKPDGWEPPDIAAILARQPPLASVPERPTNQEIQILSQMGMHSAIAGYRERTGRTLIESLQVFQNL
jgi:predicted HAD superfamily Cof-like phosphohydrolase